MGHFLCSQCTLVKFTNCGRQTFTARPLPKWLFQQRMQLKRMACLYEPNLEVTLEKYQICEVLSNSRCGCSLFFVRQSVASRIIQIRLALNNSRSVYHERQVLQARNITSQTKPASHRTTVTVCMRQIMVVANCRFAAVVFTLTSRVPCRVLRCCSI